MRYPPHPDDEWVEITGISDPEPVYIMGRSGAEIEIAVAKAKYVADQITLEQFDSVVARVMQPN